MQSSSPTSSWAQTSTTVPTTTKVHKALELCKKQVLPFDQQVIEIRNQYLNYKVANSKAGQISTCYHLWCIITSDPVVVKTIGSERIELIDKVPPQNSYLVNSINKEHVSDVENEIHTLMSKGVIFQSYHERDEYISPIFSVPKSDGTIRLIVNLKQYNESVECTHFEMESIHTILELVTPSCWMASIDLKDAYYSVKIHPQSTNSTNVSITISSLCVHCLPK